MSKFPALRLVHDYSNFQNQILILDMLAEITLLYCTLSCLIVPLEPVRCSQNLSLMAVFWLGPRLVCVPVVDGTYAETASTKSVTMLTPCVRGHQLCQH